MKAEYKCQQCNSLLDPEVDTETRVEHDHPPVMHCGLCGSDNLEEISTEWALGELRTISEAINTLRDALYRDLDADATETAARLCSACTENIDQISEYLESL